MRPGALCRAAAALALLAGPAVAHGIEATAVGDGRIGLAVRDTAGTPLARETARVYPPGADTPAAVAVTDDDGRLWFTATRDGTWRIDLIAPDGHADRALVRVANGLAVTGGGGLPRWLLAASLTGNIVAFLLVAATRLRRRTRGQAGR